ncbi:MAG TPA: hypothetical protein VND93_02435, partial [Myxococcales bacterium]|nr:hypothetical protein [Myxococcales bacterium]
VLYLPLMDLAEPLRAVLLVPVAAMVGLTILAYPLRWATSAVYGLQDAVWTGAANVLQPLVQVAIIVGLAEAGHGLLGLAVGTAAPPLIGSLVTWARLRTSRPSLARLARAPAPPLLRELFREGSRAWVGAVGWLLAVNSDLLVLRFLGFPFTVATVYSVTALLPSMLMNLAWTLPDSANVGLAHLKAEGSPERVRSVVAMLALANLLLIGGVSCLVLCVNPTFVPLWMKDPGLYGGEALNLMFVADVVVLSAGHALLVPMGVLGHRRAAGLLQLCASLAQLVLAAGLGRAAGPAGVAAAGPLITALLVLPVGAVLIGRYLGKEAVRALGAVAARWLPRWAPVAAACWWAGRTVIPRAGWPGVVAGAALAGMAYLLALRPLFRELPWGGRAGTWLRRLRVI